MVDIDAIQARADAVAEFTAMARTDIPELIAEVKRLRRYEDRVIAEGHREQYPGCGFCALVAEDDRGEKV